MTLSYLLVYPRSKGYLEQVYLEIQIYRIYTYIYIFLQIHRNMSKFYRMGTNLNTQLENEKQNEKKILILCSFRLLSFKIYLINAHSY